MRKSRSRRPELERLESMTLLSGVAAAGQVAAATVVQFSGSLIGTLSRSGKIQGSGTLNPVGKVTVTGREILSSVAPGQVTLSNKLGKLTLAMNLTSIGDNMYVGTYMITSGTKMFASDTGGGSLRVALTRNKFEAFF